MSRTTDSRPQRWEILPLSGDPAITCQGDDRLMIVPISSNVLFPHNTLPITDGMGLRASDSKAARSGKLRVGIVSNRESADGIGQLSPIGTEAVITDILKLPDGKLGAVVRGERRFVLHKAERKRGILRGVVDYVGDRTLKRTANYYATVKLLRNLVAKTLNMNSGLSSETAAILSTSDDPDLICNLVAPHLSISADEKLALLQEFNLRTRMKKVAACLSREVELLKLSDRVLDEVQGDIYESHRRQYLKEQIKAIRRELGEMEGGFDDELDEFEAKFADLGVPEVVQQAIERELERMSLMTPGAPEYLVSHSYLSWLADLPWKVGTISIPKLKTAREILQRDHFGLDKVKERILEYLAVLQHRRGDAKGQVLLLAGPPGVGKTSLCRSIAESLGRPLVKIALGGVRDEAEIRGHRRTYIGSMPGKIIQALRQAGSAHPVILLDEIDKVGRSSQVQGDVEAALLEVLDPEQNKTFTDHYLAVPFDLSKVIFVATANSTEAMSEPLLDRLELVEVSGYTDREKLRIAQDHAIPKIRSQLSLTAQQFRLPDAMVNELIRSYTREAGVRQLNRELTTCARKVVRGLVEGDRRRGSTPTLKEWLGPAKYLDEPNHKTLTPGVAIGLAYTSVGGDILYVEAKRIPGKENKGRVTLTGSLGKVMQESAQAVVSYLVAHGDEWGLDGAAISQSHIHIHFPDGGTPKDGPSAGVAILAAIASCFQGHPLPADLAMTGEVTLRGQVLAVGGIKEKVLAAHRYGKKRVLVPKSNKSDLDEIPADVLSDLEVILADTMQEVLECCGATARKKSKTRSPRRRSKSLNGWQSQPSL